jgi:hypothetical protein
MQLAGLEWTGYVQSARKRRRKFGITPRGYVCMPRIFVLPGPYVITMGRRMPAAMREQYGEYYDAMWDRETRHLDFNKRCPIQRKWWLFAQLFREDIVPAWLDWMEAQGIANQAGKRPAGQPPKPRRPYRPKRQKGKFIGTPPPDPASHTD